MRLFFFQTILVALTVISCSSGEQQKKTNTPPQINSQTQVEALYPMTERTPTAKGEVKTSNKMTYYRAKRICKDLEKKSNETRQACIRRIMKKVSALSD